MFPAGHAKNTTVNLHDILQRKFKMLGKLALDTNDLVKFVVKLENIGEMSNEDLDEIYDCNLRFAEQSIDEVIKTVPEVTLV